MHYQPSATEAFNSVEHIMRDVNYGLDGVERLGGRGLVVHRQPDAGDDLGAQHHDQDRAEFADREATPDAGCPMSAHATTYVPKSRIAKWFEAFADADLGVALEGVGRDRQVDRRRAPGHPAHRVERQRPRGLGLPLPRLAVRRGGPGDPGPGADQPAATSRCGSWGRRLWRVRSWGSPRLALLHDRRKIRRWRLRRLPRLAVRRGGPGDPGPGADQPADPALRLPGRHQGPLQLP
jgi:hypothetical protein